MEITVEKKYDVRNCNEILMRVSSKMYLNDTVAKADAKLISDTGSVYVCAV